MIRDDCRYSCTAYLKASFIYTLAKMFGIFIFSAVAISVVSADPSALQAKYAPRGTVAAHREGHGHSLGNAVNVPNVFSGDGKAASFNFGSYMDGKITLTVTKDLFETVTNVVYNSIPVTLTNMVKATLTAPVSETVTTAVDDIVLVKTVPHVRTDTTHVTDTSTVFKCRTLVSTEVFTITRRAYDIRQQILNSTVVATTVVRPTVVSTRIDTEYEAETVSSTVYRTMEVPHHYVPYDLRHGPVAAPAPSHPGLHAHAGHPGRGYY